MFLFDLLELQNSNYQVVLGLIGYREYRIEKGFNLHNVSAFNQNSPFKNSD